MVFRHRPDIESISARCRPDIVDDIWPTSSPRANMESARYQPTFADIGPIYFADIRPMSWPTFADIGPTSSLYGVQTSARHRVYIGQISLTTSGRHRAHVQTWSRPDISRHLPISARYNFRHQADVVADICRYRADIWPIVLCYLGCLCVLRGDATNYRIQTERPRLRAFAISVKPCTLLHFFVIHK